MIETHRKGAVAWMAENSVAANLLMLFLMIGGLLFVLQAKQEVFPEFELDIVSVSVAYPGASPQEVERGIVLAIEEEVRGLDGVKRVTSSANEGSGSVRIELLLGTNGNKALQDVKSAVDRITSFPQDAERPVVSLASLRRAVISLVLYGDLEEEVMRLLGEQVRDELLQLPNITVVQLGGVRPPEIGIEVPQANLRAYNLTLEGIASEVSRAAVELPAGGVKTQGGEILLRTAERRDFGSEFADIPIVSRADGSSVSLSEIAEIIDGFRDTDQSAKFNGKRSVRLTVFRVGEQTPIDVSNTVKAYRDDLVDRLPGNIGVEVWDDRSEIYRDRISLLLRNAGLGLVLVLTSLGLFLEPRLAFWVTMGIPISFLGAFLMLPAMDVSINMISLFAFIVSLGIVVDDAIVVGENVYEYRQRGMSTFRAAVDGARDVMVPVTFSILTNIAAFTPLFFVTGTMGKFFRVIPATVICVLVISWIESMFVLPAHLGHQRPPKSHGVRAFLIRQQQRVSRGLEWAIRTLYAPVLRLALRNRYLTMAIAVAILVVTVGYVAGGHINFRFMPKVDTDVISVGATLPYGVNVEETESMEKRLYAAARNVLERHGGDAVCRGIYSQIGSMSSGGHGPDSGSSGSGSHLCQIQVFLVPTAEREFTASDFANEWRQEAGEIPGLESLLFDYSTGPSGGASIDVELSHSDIDVLESAAAELAESLRTFAGVKDIDDGFAGGKPQMDFKIKPEARSLGVSASELARQVRSAFYGARAFRQQRGRDEIWVMVRLPEDERRSAHDVEGLMIRTPTGGEIPLMEAAEVIRGRAYTVIKRAESRRVVDVTADTVVGVANPGKVLETLRQEVLPGLLDRYPGLQYSLEGEQREQQESLGSLWMGFVMAQFAIFGLLAIPFRSYVQPLIVMTAIPFGIIGAVGGHLIMGYELSIISMMGIVALTGVVVNDSLVLVHYANTIRHESSIIFNAVVRAGIRRFRPIMLTSLTTFCGLAPMIFETSVQARFLIPMAISLGYGVMFATLIVLFLVPSLYLIVEDFKRILGVRAAEERRS